MNNDLTLMDDLDLLKKHEVVIQDLIYRNSALQVDVPVHPAIFSLDEKITLDRTIPTNVILNNDFARDCENDINNYIQGNTDFSPEEISDLRLNDYRKFNSEWTFLFTPSDRGAFLDLHWNDGHSEHTLGYISCPSYIQGDRKSHNSLWSAKELSEQQDIPINSLFYGINSRAESSLILFETPEKFSRFHGEEIEQDNLSESIETTVHTFSSSYLENIPQAIILRNFAVEYLNKLTYLAFNTTKD